VAGVFGLDTVVEFGAWIDGILEREVEAACRSA
jgi:hypothetical protein